MKEKVMIGGNNNEHKTRENAESAAAGVHEGEINDRTFFILVRHESGGPRTQTSQHIPIFRRKCITVKEQRSQGHGR